MIVQRKVCFAHNPFFAKDGTGSDILVGLQLDLYATFQDPRHLSLGDAIRNMMNQRGTFIVSASVFPISRPVQALRAP